MTWRTKTLGSRNNRGLTTLEWLLIVAAVAGLAALAVVLVQNVVDETAEQISGSSARLTAARVAADAITSDKTASDADRRAKCDRLQITYATAFAETPEWAALWSDADSNASNMNGECFVIHKALKTAMAATTQKGTGPSDCGPKLESGPTTARVAFEDLPKAAKGGATVIDRDDDAVPKCHLK